jgi:ferritin-like metal-binding protein YciE
MAASLKSLEDAFARELQDILGAEQQLLKSLPKMAKKASSSELQDAFHEHTRQTERQVDRVKQVFESIGRPLGKAHKCEGIVGILKEGEAMMKTHADPEVLDAELIGAAQKAEHYEIAAYSTACQWAEQLGYEEAYDLLGQNLYEEREAERKLGELARKRPSAEAEWRTAPEDADDLLDDE